MPYSPRASLHVRADKKIQLFHITLCILAENQRDAENMAEGIADTCEANIVHVEPHYPTIKPEPVRRITTNGTS